MGWQKRWHDQAEFGVRYLLYLCNRNEETLEDLFSNVCLILDMRMIKSIAVRTQKHCYLHTGTSPFSSTSGQTNVPSMRIGILRS